MAQLPMRQEFQEILETIRHARQQLFYETIRRIQKSQHC